MSERQLEAVNYQFPVTLEELLEANGLVGLNDLLDEDLERHGIKHYPSDIGYEVVGLQGGQILIEAHYVPIVDEDEEEDDA